MGERDVAGEGAGVESGPSSEGSWRGGLSFGEGRGWGAVSSGF